MEKYIAGITLGWVLVTFLTILFVDENKPTTAKQDTVLVILMLPLVILVGGVRFIKWLVWDKLLG